MGLLSIDVRGHFRHEPDGEGQVKEDPTVLSCAEGLSQEALAVMHSVAPWMMMAPTVTNGIAYDVNRWKHCDKIQSGHYACNPNLPTRS